MTASPQPTPPARRASTVETVGARRGRRRGAGRLLALAVATLGALFANPGSALADTPGGTAVIGTKTVTCHVSSCPNLDIKDYVVDMNGDGHPDIASWNWGTGVLTISLLDGTGNVTGAQRVTWTCGYAGQCSDQWWVRGFADMNGDGHTDVLWWNTTTGQLASWLLDGSGTVTGTQTLSWSCSAAARCAGTWFLVGLADVNGDGHTDVTWWNPATGVVSSWLLNGSGTVTDTQTLDRACRGTTDCAKTFPTGTTDENGDGRADLTWLNSTTGQLTTWLLNGAGHVTSLQSVNWTCPSTCGEAMAPVDMNGDGQPDVPWRIYDAATDTNRLVTWLLNKPDAAPPPQHEPCPICH